MYYKLLKQKMFMYEEKKIKFIQYLLEFFLFLFQYKELEYFYDF